jgi:hypothetical protein
MSFIQFHYLNIKFIISNFKIGNRRTTVIKLFRQNFILFNFKSKALFYTNKFIKFLINEILCFQNLLFSLRESSNSLILAIFVLSRSLNSMLISSSLSLDPSSLVKVYFGIDLGKTSLLCH